jgi:hypothetical protein
MDPVTGSENEEDKTEATLKKCKLHSKDEKKKLLELLLTKGIELFGVFLFSGFDMRAKNFRVDLSFYEAFKDIFGSSNFEQDCSLYATRIGVSHAVLSTWSKYPKYKNRLIESLKLTEKEGYYEQSFFSPNLLDRVKEMMRRDLDVDITKNILDFILNKGSADQEFLENLDNCTKLTTEMLSSCKDIEYKYPSGSFEDWFFRGENNITSVELGKRDISPDTSNKLKNLLDKWKSN